MKSGGGGGGKNVKGVKDKEMKGFYTRMRSYRYSLYLAWSWKRFIFNNTKVPIKRWATMYANIRKYPIIS